MRLPVVGLALICCTLGAVAQEVQPTDLFKKCDSEIPWLTDGVMTPDGETVHKIDRIRTFNADWVCHALRAVLAKHADFNAPSGDSADELVRGGDCEKALDAKPSDYWRGVALRRLRRGDDALKAL